MPINENVFNRMAVLTLRLGRLVPQIKFVYDTRPPGWVSRCL